MEQEKLTRLIKQARQGDQSAQEALLAAVQDRVYYHCKKMLKNEQDAQDAAQDVLIAVLTGLDKLREPGAFWGWVNGITANRCRHLLSAPHKEWQIPEDEEGNSMLESVENLDQTLVPEAVLDDGETRRMILELVDALPPEQRMSVLFYYYDEMSVKDIAQAMEVSEGTVKSRLNYARKSIRSGVEEYERKGVKLYSLSPLVLLVLFLRQEADGMQLPPQAAAALSGKVLAGAKEAATSTAAAEGTAAGSAATGGNAAATAAKAGLSTKVIAGIVAGALLIGGGAMGISSMVGSERILDEEDAKGSGQSPWTEIVAGYSITGVVDRDGTLWTWGGDPDLFDEEDLASIGIKAAEDVRTAAFGGGNRAILKTDGSLWMWGAGDRGQLGNGATESSNEPIKVMEDVAQISLGDRFVAALKTDGSLWTWGDHTYGQLGVNVYRLLGYNRGYSAEPLKVMDGVVKIDCGDRFTMAITEDGSLWAVGGGPIKHDEDPGKIMDGVSDVACGSNFVAILKTDGTLWTSGIQAGSAPDSSIEERRIPVKVMDDVVSVDCGDLHVAALKEDGTLWTWGRSRSGQLGNGTLEDCYVPTKVLDGVTDMACGLSHTAALREDGTVWAWGGIIQVSDEGLPRLGPKTPIELFLMEDGPDTPLWTLTEKEPEEDSPEVPAFPEAYAAYAQVLEEHRELIGDYCKWYEEMGSSIRPVAFTDVCGDSTPEMIFVEADPDLPLSQSHLTIVTFRDGQAATILREDWDFYAGSGLKYTLFQEKDSQPLYAKTSYYTSQKVEERYAFTESEGALHMEPVEDTPSSGLIVISNQGKSGMGMTLDEAAAFLAENMTP